MKGRYLVNFYDPNDSFMQTERHDRRPKIGDKFSINGIQYMAWYVEETSKGTWINVRLELA